jgi:ABC-2 type transport system permease protein
MIATVLWELSRRRWFLLWWTLGITSLVALTVLSYLALEDQAQQLDQAFGDFSGSAASFLGGSDLFSPAGYLSSQVYYITLPILLIIMMITLVSGLMSRDENDLTVELALARPIGRLQLLAAKALTVATIVSIVAVISYVAVVICAEIANLDINQGYLALTHFMAFAFSASFGAVAFALIAMSRLTRRFGGIVAVMLCFGSYLVSSLAGFVDVLEPVAKALPFHYYDTLSMLSGKVDQGLVIYLAGIAIVTVVVSAIGYRRRDIG